MNDRELDKQLKAAREPNLPADYMADFPRAVISSFGRRQSVRPEPNQWSLWMPRVVWSGLAVSIIAFSFILGHWQGRHEIPVASDLLADARVVHEAMTLFPNQVRAIVDDGNGPKLLLADKAEIPNSPPLFVKVCDGQHCTTLVTFSGQEIQIAGQKFTVLSQADGGIILEGNKFVWSSSESVHTRMRFKIEAKKLTAHIL